MRTHLFIAPSPASFGEVVLAIRLAHELHARGDRIVFLLPSNNDVLLAGAPFQVGRINRMIASLDKALPAVVGDLKPDTVVLVDLMILLTNASRRGIDPAYLDALPATVVALDIWDMRRNVLRLDTLGGELDVIFPATARHLVPRRMVPVPFVRPDAQGAYCALPAPSELTGDDRARMRAQLGLEEGHRLVLLTTSNFQGAMLGPRREQENGVVLSAISRLCQEAGDDVRVLHVGPRGLPDGGPRYRHHAQLAPGAFQRVVHAADLVVTPNQSATTISTALAHGVPAMAVISTRVVPDRPPGFPFRVFPLGFNEFVAGLMVDNPYCDAVPAVELHPGDEIVDGVRRICFDGDARAAATARAGAYLAEVRRLPSAAARFYGLLDEQAGAAAC